IRLVTGREFTQSDMLDAASGLVVNQSFTRKFFPRGNAVGQEVTVFKRSPTRPDIGEPIHGPIIGVVADVKAFGLDQPTQPEVFVPYTRNLWSHMFIVARVVGDTQAAMAMMKRTVAETEPALPLAGAVFSGGLGFQEVKGEIASRLSGRRFNAVLLSLFAS